jgi:DNA invertase Pin-like site-specific DNA recombinase
VQWCSDEGVSGTLDAVDRAGLACVLEAIEAKVVEGLVVARLDRLARRLHVQEAALAHVWMLGGKAFSADAGEVLQDDPDDPMRTAMRQMMGVFSELERSMIAKRMRDGRRQKGDSGGYAYGAPSFGFRAESRSLVEDDSEQAAIHRIAQLAQDGNSLRAIAATLTQEGFAPKRSSKWHPESLRKIISRLELSQVQEKNTK